jgi:nucleotidyltransferase/DNA polymerase involved in DNA repair
VKKAELSALRLQQSVFGLNNWLWQSCMNFDVLPLRKGAKRNKSKTAFSAATPSSQLEALQPNLVFI